MLTYQYRIYPTKSQQKAIDQQLQTHRNLYNKCLELKIAAYKASKTSLSDFDLIKSEIPNFKGLANYSAMQQTVRRLGKSFASFFKKHGGFPRFKNEKRFNTIEFARIGDGCKLHDKQLYIQYVGKIVFKPHRKFGEVKTISLTRRNNAYYVNVICQTYNGSLPKRETSVGIDFGIKTTLTTSDGEKYQSPYFYQEKQKQIARLNRNKNYKALQKVHTKIANKRKDFNHKLSRSLVNRYDIILIEDLKVEDITKEYINKKLYNIGINQLKTYLLYKAESAGKLAVLVNPAYSTKTCVCGQLNELKLTERTYVCGSCGYTQDRDIHAANNIKTRGLASLGFIP